MPAHGFVLGHADGAVFGAAQAKIAETNCNAGVFQVKSRGHCESGVKSFTTGKKSASRFWMVKKIVS